MSKGDYSRRRFIRDCATSGMMALGIQGLAACGNGEKSAGDATAAQAPTSCDDLSAVSESDIATREKLGYVKTSPIADNQCQNCNLFLPPKEGQKCGGCMLFKGPVFAEAYCTYWAPKL